MITGTAVMYIGRAAGIISYYTSDYATVGGKGIRSKKETIYFQSLIKLISAHPIKHVPIPSSG